LQTSPLTGIRVLEIGSYISVPYAGSLLCALGAEVVKVERPVTGDDFRRQIDHKSPYFRQYNAGKRSLAVDLKRPEGSALVRDLVPRFDVVVENMRPGKMDALGLGPDDLLPLRPDLVYASVTGFGSGGPLALRPAYDTIGQSFGGIVSVLSDTGSAGLSGTCMADLVTGLTTVTGIVASLVGRNNGRGSQHVETSLMEAVSTITIDAMTQYFEDGHQDPTRQSRHPQAQNFVLATASDEHIALHLSSSQKFWFGLLQAMDKTDLADDPRFLTYDDRRRNYFALVDIVQAVFLTKPSDEWEKLLIAADVPFAPVLGMGGYLAHPQIEWLEMAEPEENGLSLLRPPWRFDGDRPHRAQTTPKVGEHSEEIAAEVYDRSRIDALVAAGTLYLGG
jgi:crotonobetainyl-CoA:carnitine CoA-transferase CaiB-like acyl-CoA transferase